MQIMITPKKIETVIYRYLNRNYFCSIFLGLLYIRMYLYIYIYIVYMRFLPKGTFKATQSASIVQEVGWQLKLVPFEWWLGLKPTHPKYARTF